MLNEGRKKMWKSILQLPWKLVPSSCFFLALQSLLGDMRVLHAEAATEGIL